MHKIGDTRIPRGTRHRTGPEGMHGIEPLPTSLEAAIEVMERSELVAEALGEHVFDYFLRNKRAEWREYRAQVTPFELQRFLPLV